MQRTSFRLFELYNAAAAVVLVWAAAAPTLEAWDDADELQGIAADCMTAELEGCDRVYARARR